MYQNFGLIGFIGRAISLKLANTRQTRGQHIRVRGANDRLFFFVYLFFFLLFWRASFREKKKEKKRTRETRARVSRLENVFSRAPRQIGTMGLDAARAKQIAANKSLMYDAASWRGPIHKNKINFTLGW